MVDANDVQTGRKPLSIGQFAAYDSSRAANPNVRL